MALFSRTKKKEETSTAVASPKGGVATPRQLTHILKNPRITEKATLVQSFGVYVFDIAPKATKSDIMRTVERIFKVKPVSVRIVKNADKFTRNMRTGKRGIDRGGKKAYVYLKKGDTINLA